MDGAPMHNGHDLELETEPGPRRPRTRGDCEDGPRPCPWVGCRYNLMLEVTEAGGLRPMSGYLPDRRLDGAGHTYRATGARRDPVVSQRRLRQDGGRIVTEVAERLIEWFTEHDLPTCALDVAEQGEHTLDAVGEPLGITRERVRQVETRALDDLARSGLLPFRRQRAPERQECKACGVPLERGKRCRGHCVRCYCRRKGRGEL